MEVVASQANALLTPTALTPLFARTLNAEILANHRMLAERIQFAELLVTPFPVDVLRIPKVTPKSHVIISSVQKTMNATEERLA